MVASRFFVTDRLKKGTLSFEGAEFHHMVRVTRHQVGDTVLLFDGVGREAPAEIEHISRHAATLKVGRVETLPVEPGLYLVLAVAMPKATRAVTLVEKAVELGVSKIVPITTSRSVVDPRPSKLDQLRNNIIAASKQCGRSRLMEVGSVLTWSQFVSSNLLGSGTAVAHPGGVPFNEGLVRSILPVTKSGNKKGDVDTLVAVVGPEGGFTVEEITQTVTRGARLVSLGPRVLRVETAALMMASVFTSAQMNA